MANNPEANEEIIVNKLSDSQIKENEELLNYL